MKSRLRLAVIGVGHLGRHHARILASLPDAQLCYVVDIIEARARGVTEIFGGIPLKNYRDIPLDQIDAVSVVTPTTTHRDITEYFLSRGIPVFVEKPMAHDSKNAEALLHLSETLSVPLFVGHVERFNPAYDYLRQQKFSMMFIDITRVHPYVTRGVDVDIITDLMIHDIDLLCDLIRGKIHILDAIGLPVVTPQLDAASVRLEWETGKATLVASRVSRNHMRRWTIFATGQYTLADFHSREVSIIKLDYSNPSSFSLRDFTLKDFGEPLEKELQAFIQVMGNGSLKHPILADGVAGYQALEFVEQIKKVIHHDRWQELAPWVNSPSPSPVYPWPGR